MHRDPQGHHRHRGGNPPTAGGPRQRGAGAYRRTQPTRRPRDHRTGSGPRGIDREDPGRDGRPSLAVAARPDQAGRPRPRRPPGPAQHRRTHPSAHHRDRRPRTTTVRSEEHTSELQSRALHSFPTRRSSDLTKLADPAHAARLALHSIAGRIRALSIEIAALERQLSTLVKRVAPKTLKLLGVGPVHAAQMLITAGQNIDRIHSETAFAHLCAADPIPASSGKTQRHRLNPGGNRAANRTLYMIAVVRLRYCQRTRDYLTRRTNDGKTKKEAIRCLKRYIARELYYTLRADLKNLANTT